MSFAGKVKEELLGQMGKARHCQLAELAAFFAVCGQIYMNEEGECQVKFVTENLTVAKKCYMLVTRVFHIVPDVSVSGHHQYSSVLQTYLHHPGRRYPALRVQCAVLSDAHHGAYSRGEGSHSRASGGLGIRGKNPTRQ